MQNQSNCVITCDTQLKTALNKIRLPLVFQSTSRCSSLNILMKHSSSCLMHNTKKKKLSAQGNTGILGSAQGALRVS